MLPLHPGWALPSARHRTVLCPGMLGWCHPGCKKQLDAGVPGQVPAPSLLRPEGR